MTAAHDGARCKVFPCNLGFTLLRPPLGVPSPRPPPILSHRAAARLGLHTISHTSVDPDQLIEELALVADTLTHGLVCEWGAAGNVRGILRPASSIGAVGRLCLHLRVSACEWR